MQLLYIGRHALFQHKRQRPAYVLFLLGRQLQPQQSDVGPRGGKTGCQALPRDSLGQALEDTVLVQPARLLAGTRGIPGETTVYQSNDGAIVQLSCSPR